MIEQLVNTLVRLRLAGRVTPARPPAIEVTQEPIGPSECHGGRGGLLLDPGAEVLAAIARVGGYT